MTKIERLYNYMQRMGVFTTGNVIRWGADHHFTRADRAKRELMERGKIRKLSQNEMIAHGFGWCGAGVYEIVHKEVIV